MTKVVVTICQTKRTVLPYFNIKYTLPKMESISNFEFKVFLIQHCQVADFLDSTKCYYETKKISNDAFDRVQEWTKQNRYCWNHYDENQRKWINKVTIIKHAERLGRYPSLPSMRKGIEKAIEEDADFHIWLEDDAIICDRDIQMWSQLIPNGSIATYDYWEENGSRFMKSAWVITTKDFDKRILPYFSERNNWNCRKGLVNNNSQVTERLEGALAYLGGEHIVKLSKAGRVARIHLDNNMNEVVNLIKGFAKDEIQLLKSDFPEAWRKYEE